MESGEQAWRVVRRFGDWELVIIAPDDYSSITDVELTSPTGTRYLGSVGTPEMVRQLLDGGDPWNDPFWMSDLVMVSELSQASIEAAVKTLIDREEVVRALDRVDDDGQPDGLDAP